MRVRTILLVRFLLPCLLSVLLSSAQLPPNAVVSARLLDSHIQELAFKALFSPRTGVPYDAQVPTNLTGIKVSAMRLRSGSLRTRGVHSYEEFEIPIGVIVEQPHVERLVLVYQNLGNWSNKFYPLPGYSYLAPVLGLLAYNGANLSASELPELDIRASYYKPVLINFPDVKPAPFGSFPKCAYFDLHGSVQFDILLPGNMCSTVQQGHFSIVVESNAPSPTSSGVDQGGGKNNFMLRIVVASVVAGILLLIMLVLLVAAGVRGTKQRSKILELERVAESNETLDITYIGDTKVPLASGTRTRPIIEHDYIP
ncbi:uncharacterized protein LOC113848457 [Abrus precatorius]|uniref:Uncharacterized protein LOC113848457 n=1 Tax=Abrus precatorius TaxID=3816 RepID=A0A8B8JT86_ABRPR|nr:uncharacterized protein LOC113848457 [Abrus precatorius]